MTAPDTVERSEPDGRVGGSTDAGLVCATRYGIGFILRSAFGLIAAMVLLIGIAAYLAFGEADRTIRFIGGNSLPDVELALTLARDGEALAASANGLLAASTPGEVEQRHSALRARFDSMDAAIVILADRRATDVTLLRDISRALRATISDIAFIAHQRLDHERQVADTVRTVLRDYQELSDQVDPLVQVTEIEIRHRLLSASAPAMQAELDSLGRLQALRANINLVLGGLVAIATTEDPRALQDLKSRLDWSTLMVKDALDGLQTLPEITALRTQVSRLIDPRRVRNRLLGLQEARALNRGLSNHAVTDATTLSGLLSDSLAKMVEATRVTAATQIDGAQRSVSAGMLTVVMLAAIILLVTAAVGVVYVDRRVLRRTAALSEAMLNIAGGRIDTPMPRPGRDELGQMASAVAVFRDAVANLTAATDDLRESEARQRAILESAPFPILMLDGAGEATLFANRRARHLFGSTVPDIRGIFEDPDAYDHLQTAVQAGYEVNDAEIALRDAEGRRFFGVVACVGLAAAVGGGQLLAINDITRRRQAEDTAKQARDAAERALADLKSAQESLVQAEKMASLAQLIAGIAHEVNTPVGITLSAASQVEGEVQHIQAMLADGTLSRSDLTDALAVLSELSRLMQSNANRAADLIQGFKNVAVDQSSGERRSFDLKAYTEEVLNSLRPKLKHTPHTVICDIADGIEIDSYPGALAQVITNLFMNCLAHAFDAGAPGTMRLEGRRPQDGVIELRFSDDGKGIKPKHLKKIFDPFFTTKRGRGGSGLGLHIVFNLITHTLCGSIAAESRTGQGALFIMRFPVVAPDEELPAVEDEDEDEALPAVLTLRSAGKA